MSDINNVIITGTLLEAPVVRRTDTGFPIITIRIQCVKDYQDRNGKAGQKVACLTVKAKGSDCENRLGRITTGNRIAVNGAMSTESYIDQYGAKKFQTVIDAYSVHVLWEQGAIVQPRQTKPWQSSVGAPVPPVGVMPATASTAATAGAGVQKQVPAQPAEVVDSDLPKF